MTFPFLSHADMALKHVVQDTRGQKSLRIAERRRRSADRAGHASFARSGGGTLPFHADCRVWAGREGETDTGLMHGSKMACAGRW